MLVFAHLLNDASGSPRVLLATIKALGSRSSGDMLTLGSDGNGLLSHSGLRTKRYWYKRTSQRLLTLFTYLLSQLFLFFGLLLDRSIDRNAIIYVNTLMPFGAALYGRLTGRKVIYHIHEMSIQPRLLQWLLTRVVKLTSSMNIYVSNTHMQGLPVEGVESRLVYNALDSSYMNAANTCRYLHRRDGIFTVLMVASLRGYKGVPEFVQLAAACRDDPHLRFELLVNDSEADIERFLATYDEVPPGLQVFPCVADTVPFFSRASLVVNLTRVDQCVETFGMTILEAMAFGIPVIAPPVGGPAELVADGVQGYLIDSREHADLRAIVSKLADDAHLCARLSNAARVRASMFSDAVFAENLKHIVGQVGSARN